ncbi:Phytochrome-like protein cph2 [Pseudidiomarina piscicola]|uniref:Phytochrome-like protein cph2 n=1 Tax=Pseudidiomarina piscicola TaxID=2614830 RepID=A0A6S6WK04_9GAMM|nr:EAL domain-containing protein [Pseudidiomarina piscicola]CAB0150179.1 Phytochrome-like protein cph2 [Pseudidiomarina piscicola]VZT39618.1 Phytochrome-like protein cph2 [Pseudomonas aeruginosa]
MIHRRSFALSLVNVTLYVTISATFLFGLLGLAYNIYAQPESAFERVISTTSALVAIATALALMGLSAKRRVLQVSFAFVVFLAALHSLIVNLSLAPLLYLDFLKAIDAYFYPPVALTFLLLGITLMLNPRESLQRRWMRSFALFLVILALGAMGLHFVDNGFAYLGPHPPVTTLAAICVLLIGISLFLSSSSRILLFPLNKNSAAWITLCFVAIICTSWFSLSLNQIKTIRADAISTIEKVATARQQTIQVNIQILNRLRERWDYLDVSPTSEFAKFDVETYLRDIPHYLGIQLVDSQGRPQWQLQSERDANYLSHLNHTEVQHWLTSTPTDISMLLPKAEFLQQGRPVGLMLMPVGYEADRGFYLLVAFDLKRLISPETRLLPDYLKVYVALDDTHVISFDQSKPSSSRELQIAHQQLDIPYGEPLELSISLYSFSELANASNLRMVTATIGFLFCIAFLASAQQNAMLRKHARRLNRVRSQLQSQQKQLKLNEQQYRSLFTYHPDAVFSLDRDGLLTSANEAVLNILEIDIEQTLGAHFSAFIYPADRVRAQQYMDIALNGESARYDLRVFGRDGELLHIDITNLPIKIDNQVTGVFGIAKDITAQKQQDEQLNVLKRSINVSTNGIIISDATDPTSPVIYSNEAFCQMTGYQTDDIIGKSCDFLIGAETAPETVEKVRTALAERTECKVDVLHYRRDGSSFWDALQLTPVADSAGVISHFIGVHQDVSEHIKSQQLLATQAEHDALTNILNRHAFEHRLSAELEQSETAEQTSQPWAVLFIDLDGFKPINEAMGLEAGDDILQQVARRLGDFANDSSIIARFGGDEFVFASRYTHRSELEAFGQRLLETLAEPYPVAQQKVYLTASIGISCFCRAQTQATDLIQQADMAMSMAKRQGRNHIFFYQTETAHQQRLDVNLRNQFQQAIEQQSLQLFYQPIVELQSGQVVAVEALMRWQLADGSFVSPARFIPMAETTGQIIPASQWAFKQACKDLRILQQHQSNLRMSVNLSVLQFGRANFFEQITSTIEAYELANSDIELELTESILMDDSSHAIALIQRFREAGLSVSIDDFGTGFSSLSYLNKLPVNKLKIDRAFISEIITKQSDEAIVRGVLAMAKRLNMTVVAEGIEHSEQAVHLAGMDCDYGQGYYFAKPMSLAEMIKFLT